MSKPIHSTKFNKERSVSPGGHSGCVSTVFMSHKSSQNSAVEPQKLCYNLCCRVRRYRLIVRPCIVADGLYFGLCFPFWKLKAIWDLNRKNCWIFKTSDSHCSDNINHQLWTTPFIEGPPVKKLSMKCSGTPPFREHLYSNGQFVFYVNLVNMEKGLFSVSRVPSHKLFY